MTNLAIHFQTHFMIKKLFLLDAMALIYRAYFAFSQNHRVNSKGLNTSAMLGFTNTLHELLKSQKPSHIGIAFDTLAPTHRHTGFASYKAHREAMPEDLVKSLPYIDQIVDAFRIPKLFVDGFEADDVIGTLAKKAEKQGFTTYMMTPDKDFAQLVSDNIYMYKPAKMSNPAEIWGVQQVLDRFQIKRPEQVIDILGLWGDAADNIPGIPGIGEKRAMELIAKYDSLENVIANAEQLTGKMKENVIQFAQQGLDSKMLATIVLDVPIHFDEESLRYQTPDFDLLTAIFEELEFKTLAKRIFTDLNYAKRTALPPDEKLIKEANSESQNSTTLDMFAQLDEQVPGSSGVKSLMDLSVQKHNYQLVETEIKRSQLIHHLASQKQISIQLLTTHDDPHQAQLAGICFAWNKFEAHYVPFPADYQEAIKLLETFKIVFDNENIQLVGFDLKYTISLMKWYQRPIHNSLFDVMLAHYLIEPDSKHNLSLLSERELGFSILQSEDLLGRKSEAFQRLETKGLDYRDVKPSLLAEFAGQRADVLLQLFDNLHAKLKESDLLSLYEEVEIPLLRVLAHIENQGVKLESSVLESYSKVLAVEIEQIERRIYELAGHSFNIASPKQLGIVLFDELKVDEKPKMSKTQQYKTGEEILIKLLKKHEIVPLIMSYRSLTKLKSTYVDTLPKLVNPRTGHIHTSYNQAVAATGRLSSNNPNLQNIPVRTSEGREIRKAFVPMDDDYVMMAADYSQIELRIIAHLSQDANMLADFKEGKDIHTATAARVYHVPEEEVSKDMRRNAKSVNFGIIYGISAFGLSENVGISRKEAKEIIDQYFIQYAGIKLFMDKQVKLAREKGFVETMLKRRRYLRDINSSNAIVRALDERNAINAPIQGSSADMIKIAMIQIFNEMSRRGMKSKMILQVHDELIFDCHRSEMQELQSLVVDLMSTALPLSLPVVVDSNFGDNWLQAH